MRPIRLEIEGFTSFRQRQEIDFTDADFFALCGQTGAGKSSIIDAITFALYGSVSRLDKNTVAPVISQGKEEARVRLDFAIGDDRYTAVRVVQRGRTSATTASTREARLEHADGTSIAGDAKSVSEAVERILGLTFEHFTKCVVLPQGEFAKFLHDTPAERQRLLVQLLDLGMYERMGKRARTRAESAASRATWLAQRLEDELSYATEDSLLAARERLGTLEALWTRVEEAQPRADALKAEADAARAEATEAERRAALLSDVRVPTHVATLTHDATAARSVKTRAAADADAARAAREAADAVLAALPARGALEVAREAHTMREQAAAALERARATLAGAEDAEARARKDADAAAHAAIEARDALEAARIADVAGDLARVLVTGEACPVCLQTVAAIPDGHGAGHDLEAARRAADTASARHDEAARIVAKAERERASAETLVAEQSRRMAELDERVAAHPDRDLLEATLLRIADAERACSDAASAERAAHAALAKADAALSAADAAERDARRAFDRARDAVSALGPPEAGRDDLATDWAALAAWAADRAPAELAAAAEASARAAHAVAERKAIADELLGALEAAGVEREQGQTVGAATLNALAAQRALVERIEAALGEIARVTAERKELEEEQAVASTLGRHLSAKGFEKWLLDEALAELVAGATENLRELSSGAYSLALDAKSGGFWVVDHRNGDDRRPAKTLSGGETFLASLSLALALADRLTAMAAEGARIDAIFLDEGFGTLDAETLDAVAAAIESLAAGGRMVGLVTHVPQIAERVPIRFEVRKHPDTSRVEKVYL